MKKKWITAIIIYLVLVLTCIIVVYAVPSVRGLLEKTYVTEFGTIDITDKVSAYIMRDETVYVAGHDYEVSRLAEPGKLIKARTPVVELTPILSQAEEAKEIAEEVESLENAEGTEETAEAGKTEQTEKAEKAEKTEKSESEDGEESEEESEETEKARVSLKYNSIVKELGDSVIVTDDGVTGISGYINYHVDGAETGLSTGNVYNLLRKDFKELSGRRSVETPDGRCRKGDPLFKVVSNKKWYMVFFIDKDSAQKYYADRDVTAELGGQPVTVSVAYTEEGQKDTMVVLTCKTFFDEFFDERVIDTSVTVASAEGLILRDSSIVEDKKGQIGVFVKNKLGEHVFTPVALKADDGERSAAFSDIFVDAQGNFVETISTYDEIVEQPTEEDIKSIS